MYTKEDIWAMVKEHHVRFVRLQFTDIFGVLKNVAITVHQLDKALNNEMMFDGSSVDGFARIEESDMYLHPNLDSWVILPWGSKENTTARLICDIYNPDGTPFEGDPRYILRKAIQEAEAMGYTLNIGPEAEFFLFHTDDDGRPTLKTHDQAGYMDLTPVDLGEAARRDMIFALGDIGFEVEASHHECAPGQHEIDFKYKDALTAADNVQTFKYVVRYVAQRHGLHATFMPKPIFGIHGSGMHVNQSLYIKGKNAFYDPNTPDLLSQDAHYYLGGLLKHAQAYTAITNPTVNSYKRLVNGYEAPVYVAWATKNRSPLVRLPAKRGAATRVELRSPDPSCNPYLAFAVMLRAGLDGIKNKIEPPAPLEINIYSLTPAQLEEYGVATLPNSLENALNEMEKSDWVKETLGAHVYERFSTAKRREWDEYRLQVTPWEIENYLAKF